MEASPRKRMSIIALDELKRRDDLESLRKFLIAEACFPAQKDPETAPITMEELKKLARIWKLNERRNFWKTHTDRDEIVATLLHHAAQDKNYTAKKSASVEIHKPAPPTEARPSSAGTKLSGSLNRNYYGLKYFNRENNPVELVISSRFFAYPNPSDCIDNVVDMWRSDDFNMKDEALASGGGNSGAQASNRSSTVANGSSVSSNSGSSNSNRHLAGIRNKVKQAKQRNLAMHLMNYSAHLDFKKTSFNVKSVQTFINVAESDDSKTVSHCIIALSNIAADPLVRSILFEINAVHKITNMLQFLKGKTASWAAGLLFYYFSIDKEAEDRVYNASASLLQVNGGSKDLDARMVALFTLNNLMPCIDRQRVAEIIMRIFLQHFDGSVLKDKQIWSTFLTIMLNMAWFTNAHATLMSNQILDLLAHFSKYASQERNQEMGVLVAKVLLAFLQLPDQAANLVTAEFVNLLIPLIHDQMPEQALALALKVAVVLSSVPALRRVLRPTRLPHTVATMVVGRGSNLSSNAAKDCAKFFCNITLNDPAPVSLSTLTPSAAAAAAALASSFRSHEANLEKLVEDGVPDAVFALIRSPSLPLVVKTTVVRALQNVVSHSANAACLVSVCLDPVLKFLKDNLDLGAAQVLYNLACISQCRAELVAAKVHNLVLDHFQATKESQGALKSVFLQILVQLSSSDVCVMELLQLGLISKLESQLKVGSKLVANWKDVSLMLLAVVAYAIQSISSDDLAATVRILRIICVPGVEEEVVENCAHVVRCISGYFSDFHSLNPVVRAILELGDGEEVIDCISTVLYNMTGHTDNILPMLSDNTYLNVMIRLMRNGKAEVQENIIQAISTLCSNEKCSQLLLKHDILSDLIVIALLRTSSEEIKVICSQAFYNMLCHTPTRLDLVKGDLWWALMRLGRTDSRAVQSICIRALCDLSYPPMESAGTGSSAAKAKVSIATVQTHHQRVQALRRHNILAFMRDLSATAHADELLRCMQILHNLMSQFVVMDTSTASSINAASSSPHYDYSEAEIMAAIRTTADAVVRAPNLKTIRVALLVLLKCAQQHQFDKVFSEFLLIDIIEVLKNQRANWNKHPDCRLNVSRLLYELTQSKVFTKASSASDLNVICMALVQVDGDSPTAASTPARMDAGSLEIVENIAATLLQFSMAEAVSPKDLVGLSIWPILLKEGLSTNSSVIKSTTASFSAPLPGRRTSIMTSHSAGAGAVPNALNAVASPVKPGAGSAANTRRTLYSREQSMASMPVNTDALEALRGSAPSPFRLQGITLALLAYTIDALLTTPVGLPQMTSHLVQGLLRVDLVDHLWMRNNLLSVLQAVSQSTHCIAALLVADTFQLLLRFLNSAVGTIRQEKAQEFGACFLRNVALHSGHLSKLIAIPHGALNDFVREVCDEVQSAEAALDLSVFFFHTSNYLVQNDSSLNPKFVLEMITKLSNNEKFSSESATATFSAASASAATSETATTVANIQNINKYSLSMILNKYSFAQGVDPAFVQNMFAYMQSPAMAAIPDLMRTIEFKTIADWKGQLMNEFLVAKESVFVDLLVFYPDQAIWQPATHASSKLLNAAVLKFSQPVSLVHEKLEAAEALPSSVFSKIMRTFEPVHDGSKAGDHQAISEGDDGDGDEHGGDHEQVEVVPEGFTKVPGAALSLDQPDTITPVPSQDASPASGDGSPGKIPELELGSIRSSMGNAMLASAMAAMRISEECEEESRPLTPAGELGPSAGSGRELRVSASVEDGQSGDERHGAVNLAALSTDGGMAARSASQDALLADLPGEPYDPAAVLDEAAAEEVVQILSRSPSAGLRSANSVGISALATGAGSASVKSLGATDIAIAAGSASAKSLGAVSAGVSVKSLGAPDLAASSASARSLAAADLAAGSASAKSLGAGSVGTRSQVVGIADMGAGSSSARSLGAGSVGAVDMEGAGSASVRSLGAGSVGPSALGAGSASARSLGAASTGADSVAASAKGPDPALELASDRPTSAHAASAQVSAEEYMDYSNSFEEVSGPSH